MHFTSSFTSFLLILIIRNKAKNTSIYERFFKVKIVNIINILINMSSHLNLIICYNLNDSTHFVMSYVDITYCYRFNDKNV